jgi:hypothetical protein
LSSTISCVQGRRLPFTEGPNLADLWDLSEGHRVAALLGLGPEKDEELVEILEIVWDLDSPFFIELDELN